MQWIKRGKSDYVSNIITLFSGTLLSQIIMLLSTPFLTRIYSPEELGIYYIILSYTLIFIPIINGRLDLGIVNASTERESFILVLISLIISISLIPIILVISIIGISSNEAIISNYVYIYLIIMTIILLNSFINILNGLNNRIDNYKILAKVAFWRSLTKSIIQIAVGIFKPAAIILLLGNMISDLIIVYLFLKNKNFAKIVISLKITKFEIKEVFLKNKNYLLFSSPAILFNTLSYSLIIIFIGLQYSTNDAAFYSLALTLLVAPLTLIASNVGKVFLSHAKKENELTGNFQKIFLKTSKYLCLFSFLLFLILYLVAEPFFEIFLGEEWFKSGEFIKILAPMFMFRLIASSMSLSMIIASKQHIEFLFQLLFLISLSAVLFITINTHLHIEGFLMLISISYSIVYIIWFLFMYKYSRKR